MTRLCSLHGRRLIGGICPICAQLEAADAVRPTVELTPANRAALERAIRSREAHKADLARRHAADLARRRRPTEEE